MTEKTQGVIKTEKTDGVETILQLLEKMDRTEKLVKLGEKKSNFFSQELGTNQRTMEVNIPASYRQLPTIQ